MVMRVVRAWNVDIQRAWLDTELFMSDAANSLGMSVDSFRDRAYALGLPKRRPGPREVIRPNQEAEFRLMWRAGVSARQIARHFGCSYFAVINTAARLKLPMRGAGFKPNMSLDAFLQARLGVSMRIRATRESGLIPKDRKVG